MVLKITRWSPDTCDCVLEYQWDDTQDENSITHTPVNVVNRCTAHQILPNTPTAVYNAVNEENPRKNLSLNEILQNAPSTSWYDIDAESGSRIFKKGIIINWTWTGTAPNRVLTITFTGITLTTQQRNNLQTRLNNRFGIDKVIIG